MELKQRLVSLVCLIMAAVLVFAVAGCNKDAADQITSPGIEPTSEFTPEPEPESRRGGWLDEIIFTVVPEADAVSKIGTGEIDLFAGALSGSANFSAIQSAGINYASVSGKCYEVMLNPSDTKSKAKQLNPFASSRIREAMNWLLDRDYICQEIFGGTATPKWIPQYPNSPEYARYIEYVRGVEAAYAYNSEKAIEIINSQMLALGAEKNSDGVWTYKNTPVVVTALIRNDDAVLNQIGDYVCNELVRIGFTVDRKYKSLIDCFAIWSETDPAENEWNLYTGAWSPDGIRGGIGFQFFYSPASEYGYTELYQAYDIDDDFFAACEGLANYGSLTVDQRDAYFAYALEACNRYAFRIWICDSYSYIPMSVNTAVSSDRIGGVALNAFMPFTLRFKDQAGGSLVWAGASLFGDAVNPVGGSGSEFDRQFQIFTQDYGILKDPYTDLGYRQRIAGAEVVVQTGLPVVKTSDWVRLSFQDEIAVPEDAMVDWDPVSQTWLTADQDYLNSLVADAAAWLATAEADNNSTAEEISTAAARVDEAQAIAERGYLTARRKSVVTYPADLYDMLWHDGTNLSAADFMMAMIVKFDLGSEGSAYHDPSLAASLAKFKQSFKGWRILSVDPLTIEYYSDLYYTDAEDNVETLWPAYGRGQSNWADMAVSLRAVSAGDAALTEHASDNSGKLWLDWLSGPSLKALEDSLVACIEDQFIPYEPAMSRYVTAEQALGAYDNILNFYSEYGHFYIGCGPYFISSADPAAMTLTLSNFDRYIDPAAKWPDFTGSRQASVKIEGPDTVARGVHAVFGATVSLEADGGLYPADQIQSVKYIVYDADGLAAWHGEGSMVQQGMYNITLEYKEIANLKSGTCRLEVVVVPVSGAGLRSAAKEFTVE